MGAIADGCSSVVISSVHRAAAAAHPSSTASIKRRSAMAKSATFSRAPLDDCMARLKMKEKIENHVHVSPATPPTSCRGFWLALLPRGLMQRIDD